LNDFSAKNIPFKNMKISNLQTYTNQNISLNDFSAKNIPFKNMKIQKSWFQNLGSLFFKHFSAKNIPFKIASPKMGNFIDWNFTLTILGDANGGSGYMPFYALLLYSYGNID